MMLAMRTLRWLLRRLLLRPLKGLSLETLSIENEGGVVDDHEIGATTAGVSAFDYRRGSLNRAVHGAGGLHEHVATDDVKRALHSRCRTRSSSGSRTANDGAYFVKAPPQLTTASNAAE